MKQRIRGIMGNKQLSYWLSFAGKTAFYVVIMFVLIYFYHFSHIGGTKFIYNEF